MVALSMSPPSSPGWLNWVQSHYQELARAATPKMTAYIAETPTPKQQMFLLLTCQEAMYGGAAGPGKSSAMLMSALQWVDTPGYAAIILRRIRMTAAPERAGFIIAYSSAAIVGLCGM